MKIAVRQSSFINAPPNDLMGVRARVSDFLFTRPLKLNRLDGVFAIRHLESCDAFGFEKKCVCYEMLFRD